MLTLQQRLLQHYNHPKVSSKYNYIYIFIKKKKKLLKNILYIYISTMIAQYNIKYIPQELMLIFHHLNL